MLRIDINEDIEKIKESVAWGFNLHEMLFLSLGIICEIISVLVFVILFKLPLMLCIYLGIPFAAPAILTGFYKKDGMTIWEQLKRKRERKKMKPLVYRSTECVEMQESLYEESLGEEVSEEEAFGKIIKKIKIGGIIFGIVFLIAVIAATYFLINRKHDKRAEQTAEQNIEVTEAITNDIDEVQTDIFGFMNPDSQTDLEDITE